MRLQGVSTATPSVDEQLAAAALPPPPGAEAAQEEEPESGAAPEASPFAWAAGLEASDFGAQRISTSVHQMTIYL